MADDHSSVLLLSWGRGSLDPRAWGVASGEPATFQSLRGGGARVGYTSSLGRASHVPRLEEG